MRYADKVLVECARRMKSVFTGADFYRIGGDEFVVIGCNDYNDNYPERFSARVNDRLRVYNKFAGNEFEVSVSIGGICKHITDIHELEDMFTQADKIMYASKLERHKNRK